MSFRVLSLLPLFLSCSIFDNEQALSENNIIGQWIHSYEEDTLAYEYTFRPKDSKEFPVSWYRNEIHLESNGNGKALILAPNDAHYFDSILWRLTKNEQGESLLTITYNNIGEVKYTISDFTSDLLLLRDTVLR